MKFIIIISVSILNILLLSAQITSPEWHYCEFPIMLKELETDSTRELRYCFNKDRKEINFMENGVENKINYCIKIGYVKESENMHWVYDYSKLDSSKIISTKKFFKITDETWLKHVVVNNGVILQSDTILTLGSTMIDSDSIRFIDPVTLSEHWWIFRYYSDQNKKK